MWVLHVYSSEKLFKAACINNSIALIIKKLLKSVTMGNRMKSVLMNF